VGLLAAPGVLLAVTHLVALLAVQVGLLVALMEVLVPVLGESVVLGLVVALMVMAVGLVEDLLKGFHQQGQTLAF
jgi:pheromone shutdown protein TraB